MPPLKNVLFFFLIILLLSSCGFSTYIPNVVNTPLMTEPFEFQSSIFIGTNHIEYQSAVSLPMNIALIGNLYLGANKNGDTVELVKKIIGEFGIGYYRKLNTDISFEIYGGYGYAKNEYHKSKKIAGGIFDSRDRKYKYISANYNRFFIQPNIGLRGEIFTVGLACPFYWINYPVYDYWQKQVLYTDKSGINTNVTGDTVSIINYSVFMLDPALTFKIGWKNIKLFAQMSYTIPFKHYEHPIYQSFLFAAGFQVLIRPNFGEIKKSSQNE